MKMLMLGTMVPKETRDYCYSMGQRIIPAELVQDYMLHGLESIGDLDSIDSLGAVRIKAWPDSKIIRIKSSSEKIKKGIAVGVGFINLPVIAFALREKAIVRSARNWAKQHQTESDVVVLIHSMHSPFMKAAKKIKQLIPNAKIVLLVADLPLFMDMRGTIRRFLKKTDWKRIQKLMPFMDKYLLYTKDMAEYLKIPDDKWMLFEGLIDEEKIVRTRQTKYSQKVALYAGNLDPRYGIDTLIDSFSKIKSDIKLYIYGTGFGSERINDLASNHCNVEYKGQVTPDEVFEIMKKATFLINPRPSGLGLAKYSCPSKTFEYMASGTPVIMNRLPGLPEEYNPYVYFFSGEDSDSFASTIDALMEMDDERLCDFGMKAAEFLLEQKNSYVVMNNVIDFIRG